MIISIASDHGGFSLKETLKDFLEREGYRVIDRGTDSDESCDYPDYGIRVIEDILQGRSERGILTCGTGIGMSILANRFRGIRAALCFNEYMARMSRLHNDSNVLVMGGRVIGPELALSIVRTWLDTPFEGGRHKRRLEKLESLVESYKG